MQEATRSNVTEAEYVEIERRSDIKHEYYQGEMFAMAGASRKHNIISSNIIRDLGNQLRQGPCRVFPSDMRVKIDRIRKYVYPDVSVVCNKDEFTDEEEDTITNPDLIIEILSDSTEAYDRGHKFAHYRKLTSLKEYVLISQDERKIEIFTKNESGYWLYAETDEDRFEIILKSVSCKLNLNDVYEKVFD